MGRRRRIRSVCREQGEYEYRRDIQCVDALTLDETDFEWGYDYGKWFRADTITGNVDEWPEPGNGRVSRALSIDRCDFMPQWNRLRIVKRGVGDIGVCLSYSREYAKFTIRIR